MPHLKLTLLIAVVSAFAISCSGGSDEPTIVASSETSAPVSTALSPPSPGQSTIEAGPPGSAPEVVPTRVAIDDVEELVELPTTEATFRVRLPDGTPADLPPHLLMMSFGDFGWTEHIPLKQGSDGVWQASAQVEMGGLVRYVYDIWDEKDFSNFKESREAWAPDLLIQNRLLLVDRERPIVNDVVAMWRDFPVEFEGGPLAGIVGDADTGEPVVNANVSAGGIHVATDVFGRFEFPRLPLIGSAIFTHPGTRQTHHPGESIKHSARPANLG